MDRWSSDAPAGRQLGNQVSVLRAVARRIGRELQTLADMNGLFEKGVHVSGLGAVQRDGMMSCPKRRDDVMSERVDLNTFCAMPSERAERLAGQFAWNQPWLKRSFLNN